MGRKAPFVALVCLLSLQLAAALHGDVVFSVSANAAGQTKLRLVSQALEDNVYTWVNYGNGTLALKQKELSVLRLNSALGEGSALLEEKLETEEQLLAGIHSARLRARAARQNRLRHGRNLLSTGAGAAGAKAQRKAALAKAALANSIQFGPQFKATGTMDTWGDLIAGGVKQWRMVVLEEFHKGTVEGWSNSGKQDPLPPSNGVSTCCRAKHEYSDYFLGNYGNMEASKDFELPAHTRLRIQARVHFIDKWEGESVYLKLGDDIVWQSSHHWCTKLFETQCKPIDPEDPDSEGFTVDVCGHRDFPDRLALPLDVTVAHIDQMATLTFGSTLQLEALASWGIDDLRLSVV